MKRVLLINLTVPFFSNCKNEITNESSASSVAFAFLLYPLLNYGKRRTPAGLLETNPGYCHFPLNLVTIRILKNK
jgi:hypothetical protein